MKKFRSFRNKKKHLSSKYILLILTGVCIVALFTSLVFNLSGGAFKFSCRICICSDAEGNQQCRFLDFRKSK